MPEQTEVNLSYEVTPEGALKLLRKLHPDLFDSPSHGDIARRAAADIAGRSPVETEESETEESDAEEADEYAWLDKSPEWVLNTPDPTSYDLSMYGPDGGTVQNISLTREEYTLLKCLLSQQRKIVEFKAREAAKALQSA